MKQENQKEKRPARKNRRKSPFLILPILLILVLGLLFFIATKQDQGNGSSNSAGTHLNLWQKITRTFSETNGGPGKKSVETTGKAASSNTNPGQEQTNQIASNQQGNSGTPGKPILPGTSPSSSTTQNLSHSPLSGENSLQATLSGNSESCQQAADKINAFYTHLDKEPYIQAFHLKTKSSVYFSELIQKLLDNPPVVTRETDDLFTVLKNTAHFYRVIGKNNITILKTILDKEKPYIENTLSDFYDLIQFPNCLQKSFSIKVPPYSIYDYAGFFLNTMGGRLYLFRRDSNSRMTVSYYGILVIDKANKEFKNRDGIQIKKAIDSLISEMENSGKQLKLKDKYLDKLYDLKEKYQ